MDDRGQLIKATEMEPLHEEGCYSEANEKGRGMPPPYPVESQQPPPPGYQPANYQLPTSNVIVVQPQPPVIVEVPVMPTNTSQVILSCFTFWFCCPIFGLIAFIYAILATRNTSIETAKNRLRIAYILSVTGICVGSALAIIIYILLLYFTKVFD